MRWSAARARVIYPRGLHGNEESELASEGEYRPFQRHSLGNVPFVTSKIFQWSAAAAEAEAERRDRAQALLFMCAILFVSGGHVS
jgi:hypothetical protein